MEKQDLQQLKTAFADTRDFLLALGDEKKDNLLLWLY